MAVNIDFGLLNGATPDFGGAVQTYVQQLQANKQQKLQDYQIKRAERQDMRADATDAARATAAGQLQTGDVKGAQQTAIGAGDFDLAKTISGWSKEQREEQATHAATLASVGFGIKSKPPTEWLPAFEAAIPLLKQRGVTDDEIAVARTNLSNPETAANYLDSTINAAVTLSDQLTEARSQRDFGQRQEEFGYRKENDEAQRAVQIRGQDRAAADAAAARAVTVRGQDLSAGAGGAGGKPPAGFRWTADGNLEAIKGGPGDKRAALTESQSKATGLYMSGAAAAQALNSLHGKNWSPSLVTAALDKGDVGATTLKEVDRQAYNAFRNLAQASLRLETGAAISPQEIAVKARQLIPLPGDGEDVLRDKAAQRSAALSALRVAAGPGVAHMKPVVDTPRAPANAPQVGTVQGGYRYTGGDPGRKTSWTRVGR